MEKLWNEKTIPGIYFIILVICAVLMLVGLIWGNTNVFSRVESMKKTQIYPVKEVQVNEEEIKVEIEAIYQEDRNREVEYFAYLICGEAIISLVVNTIGYMALA